MTTLKMLFIFISLAFTTPNNVEVHPLKLSLCEVDYSAKNQILTVNLKLFLTDVNEALTFDPNNNELAFCKPNESDKAETMLLEYLNKFFHLKIDGKKLKLNIKHKKLKGEGDNIALWVYFEYKQSKPFTTIEVKNAVFTDLFSDQNNIVYVHYNNKSKSLMLDKNKSVHQLKF